MIELTEQQWRELASGRAVEVPGEPTPCVVLRKDVYDRMRQLLEQAEDDALQGAWVDAVEEARAEMANE